MAYYTLAQRIDGRWAIQFGDYDRATVVAERDDMCQSFGGPLKRDTTIVRTESAWQADIDAAIARLNSWVIASTSTTDWNGRDPVEHFPVYLQVNRARAWWARSFGDAQLFATEADALAEMERLGINRDHIGSAVICAAEHNHLKAINDRRERLKNEAALVAWRRGAA